MKISRRNLAYFRGRDLYRGRPDRMTAALRQAKRLCLGFKILAAGRRVGSPEQVHQCFEYAFKNLKPADAVMWACSRSSPTRFRRMLATVRTLLA